MGMEDTLSVRFSGDSIIDLDSVALLPEDQARIQALHPSIAVPPSGVEYKRLEVVRQTGIFGRRESGVPGPDFDRITSLASKVFNVPLVMLFVMEVDFAWIISYQTTSAYAGPKDMPETVPRNPYCSATLMPDAPDVRWTLMEIKIGDTDVVVVGVHRRRIL